VTTCKLAVDIVLALAEIYLSADMMIPTKMAARIQGNRKVKDAATLIGSDPNFPSMRLYDRSADRQPNAHAICFRRKHRVEYPTRGAGLEAFPGVFHGHQEIFRPMDF